MTLNPKSEFLKTEEAKLAADLVATKWFQHYLTIALAQMTIDIGKADNPAKSWDSYSQISGAKRLIQVMFDLPDPRVVEKPKSTSELNYRA